VFQQPDSRVACGRGANDLGCPVAGTIVDHDDLGDGVEQEYLLDDMTDGSFFVIGWHDDREASMGYRH
jgi:hypothetical protein